TTACYQSGPLTPYENNTNLQSAILLYQRFIANHSRGLIRAQGNQLIGLCFGSVYNDVMTYVNTNFISFQHILITSLQQLPIIKVSILHIMKTIQIFNLQYYYIKILLTTNQGD